MNVANSWRIHEDHLPLWWGSQGTANIIESFANKSSYAGIQPDGNAYAGRAHHCFHWPHVTVLGAGTTVISS